MPKADLDGVLGKQRHWVAVYSPSSITADSTCQKYYQPGSLMRAQVGQILQDACSLVNSCIVPGFFEWL